MFLASKPLVLNLSIPLHSTGFNLKPRGLLFVFPRRYIFFFLLVISPLLGDCRCDSPQSPSSRAPIDQVSSIESRVGDLYVKMACLSQKDLSPEERVRAKRALYLSFAIGDSEYVKNLRDLLADVSSSKVLAERIRKECK